MSASPAAVESGRVDIAAVTGPFLRTALDTGKLRLFTHPPDAIAPHFLISAWFCTTDVANRRADDLRRFLRVLRDSAAYCNDHHAETVDMVSRFMGMDPHELSTGIRSTLGAHDPRRPQDSDR